ncbi:Na+/H+ antiporter NhaC [Limoniibacter endophyticus]|uniref:Na+/H+ antiporter NhaC n=1 Tax=Limoniibacter endophyticus TaxID=1565040 RepID=A0A8J3DQ88_9HYPH|nr:Na+/H+ antiporter NhaC [Limoniibacter endophyticus]GHC65821.1 Na+/H+ antiporter NhaC [Limoniibacter endophyticus]
MQSLDYRSPSLPMALVPIIATLAILGLQIFYFGNFTPHIPLAIGIAITAVVGRLNGLGWLDIRAGMFKVINVSLPAIGVLFMVGMIIATWIASGTVPTLIYYGLNMLSPSVFLFAAMILCAIVSVALGTSWGTVGTVGLALMGIGSGFGIPVYWTAGAIVSGAFFGDKVSPLSDTTNLASSVCGVDIFSHIRNLIPSTIPAMMLAGLVYLYVGFAMIDDSTIAFDRIETITASLEANFQISLIFLLPPLLVMVLAIRRYPPIPSLFAGVIAGAVLAMVFQGETLKALFTFPADGYEISTGVIEVDKLLNRGGLQSMMWTVSLILFAISLGGALERTGCLETVMKALIGRVRGFAMVHLSAVLASLTTNAVAGDPYLSVALPGRMFAPVYRGMRYSTLNLSRAIEEGGTLMSPLIPWNAGGAYVIAALGLATVDNLDYLLYIPASVACWSAPLIGTAYAALGIYSPRASEEEVAQWASDDDAIMLIAETS